MQKWRPRSLKEGRQLSESCWAQAGRNGIFRLVAWLSDRRRIHHGLSPSPACGAGYAFANRALLRFARNDQIDVPHATSWRDGQITKSPSILHPKNIPLLTLLKSTL